MKNARVKFNFAFDFTRIASVAPENDGKELELTGADARNIDPGRQLAVMYIVHITAEGCIKHPCRSLLAPTIPYRLPNISSDIMLTRDIFFALKIRVCSYDFVAT